MVAKNTKPMEDEPQTFNEAQNLIPSHEENGKWTFEKWFGCMGNQQVWRKMLRSLLPPNCGCMKNKWLFKIKHNGVYQAQLLACGYSQGPGVNFT